ncbi:hypothetical protein MSAN_00111700 [Mycena sanguinolenta]|uniref:Uncharacterized protein n=1 Tax=Mycena sanguinolenta TaxID=230812 RepID=A0A8H6ZGK2_9AGAR|nr:hypothetical protein MSAN_00111700 [Mycena sanguinolenta]
MPPCYPPSQASHPHLRALHVFHHAFYIARRTPSTIVHRNATDIATVVDAPHRVCPISDASSDSPDIFSRLSCVPERLLASQGYGDRQKPSESGLIYSLIFSPLHDNFILCFRLPCHPAIQHKMYE